MNIREIARKARVSHSTVSRVINGAQTVDPKLARRVNAVIEDVGYRPNYQAQSLARGRSYTVGLIVSELSGGNPFFSELILYFERAAVKSGFEVLVSFADVETNPEHITACVNRMKERRVDGIAVLTFGMEDCLKNVVPSSMPIIYAGAQNPVEGIRNLRINYLTGMRDAVRHLADFGHERIGYLSGQLSLSSMKQRYDAFRRAAKSAGIPFSKDLLVHCDHTLEGGAAGMATLLSLPKPPTAVLCCNDMAAIGALKTMSQRGLVAGRDISLVGFDDLPLCRFTQPSLSTVRFSPSELAELCFVSLMESLQGTGTKGEPEYKTHFVLRESTCAPRE